MTDLIKLSLTETIKGLKDKKFSAVEITDAYLTQMDVHKHLNAYITETPELARELAKAADKKLANGEDGLLLGAPIAVKDLFCTQGVRTTAASRMLENFVPEYESTVTAKMFAEGAVMLGKSNLDQFAMGSANITSHFNNVSNPWKRRHADGIMVPGGSSGGSAAATAAFLCAGSLGTDTGGSIRQPASFTGTVGMKPTYGRCSRWGTVAFASSLDQAGPICRTVADSALLLQAIAGFDAKDSTSVKKDVPDWSGRLKADVKGLKIGVPKEYRPDNLPDDIAALWDQGASWLRDAGAEIVEITLPHTEYALPTYYIVAPAEASSNLARYDGVRYGHRTGEKVSSLDEMYERTRAEGFGDEVKRRIMIGTYVLSHGYYDAYYKQAQKIRALIAQDFASAFEQVDAILTPTAPSAAFGMNEQMSNVEMYLNDVFTVPASLAGVPGISVPAGFDGAGLPLGLQVLTKAWDEQTCLNVAAVIEQAANLDLTPEGY